MSATDQPGGLQPARAGKDRGKLPSWRLEEPKTTLWVVPRLLVVVAASLVAGTKGLRAMRAEVPKP